jgi:hypothetical protein
MILAAVTSCKGPLSAPDKSTDINKVHKAVVKEVIQAGGYTYLNVTEKRKSTWLAIPGTDIEKGVKITYSGGMEMTDFHSRELNRTFPSILFLEGITTDSKKSKGSDVKLEGKMGEVKKEKANVSIRQPEGALSIEEIFETKDELSGKTIMVKGIITKINPAILGKNWVHIQDGTEYKGEFDLTVTTQAHMQLSDTVKFEGRISLKKDFGYGYVYEVLMEDGIVIK